MGILVINGHPDKNSFCRALSYSYKHGCEQAGGNCELVNLSDIDFNPILKYGYSIKMELEPDLVHLQKLILKASHIVFVFPIWWGTYPALFKGFIDRVFLPGYAFGYESGSFPHEEKLIGKTATVITTMNTPWWYYRFFHKRPAYYSIKKSVLSFCGISSVKYVSFTPVKKSTPLQRKNWIKYTYQMGTKMK